MVSEGGVRSHTGSQPSSQQHGKDGEAESYNRFFGGETALAD